MTTRRALVSAWGLAVLVAGGCANPATESADQPEVVADGSEPSATGGDGSQPSADDSAAPDNVWPEPVEDSAAPTDPDAGSDPGGTDGSTPLATDVPDVDVVDVATGQTTNLRSFVTGDKPLLLWFWSPH